MYAHNVSEKTFCSFLSLFLTLKVSSLLKPLCAIFMLIGLPFLHHEEGAEMGIWVIPIFIQFT